MFTYSHIGLPAEDRFDGEIRLERLKMTVSDHRANPFGVQWQRYDAAAPYPELVMTVAHVAFEVDDLAAALEGHRVIVEPNSPQPGVLVAFARSRGHRSSCSRSIGRSPPTSESGERRGRHRPDRRPRRRPSAFATTFWIHWIGAHAQSFCR